jgi:uncharacterized membrane protein
VTGYWDATMQNPLGVLFGLAVVVGGFLALWLVLRRRNRSVTALVIAAAITWVVTVLIVFMSTDLSPRKRWLVSLGIATVCWWMFNQIRRAVTPSSER